MSRAEIRLPGFRRAFRPPWRRAAADVDDEFAFHIDMRAAELAARGWPPEAARQEAIRQFGDLADARAYCRHLDERRERRHMRAAVLDAIGQDVRFAARGLRRSPGFALIAVLTLALGVGANVTMLGVVDRLLLRPPAHVRDAASLRRPYVTYLDDGAERTEASMSWPELLALRDAMRDGADVAAFYAREMVLGEGDAARPAKVTLASAELFPLLGARPALGRFFGADEDRPPAGARVAVVSHELWRRDLGGAPSAIGRRVVLAGHAFEVVGVAPAGFTGVGLERVDVWVPIASLAAESIEPYTKSRWYDARDVGWLQAVARLRPGVAAERAAAQATAGYRRAVEARGGAARVDSLRPRAALEPLLQERGPDRTPSGRIAVWLGAMSIVVLLIACANVANLLLARAHRRRRELALRASLGAGRARIASQLLVEALMLALLGGAGAVAVAHWGGRVVRATLLPDVAWSESVADGRTLALAGGVALLTGLLTGLLPAAHAGSARLVGALRAGAREGGGRRSTTRDALVVAQAALSVVLLVGAGLFVRSLRHARAVDLGFSPDRVLTVGWDLASAGYTDEQTIALHDALAERLARVPGVLHAAVGMTEPFATTIDVDIRLPGRDSVRMPETGLPRINAVSPSFFPLMGTRVRQGRAFADADRRGAPFVTIVNETMARALWPGRSPLGERVCLPKWGNACAEVVGVAEDARWRDLRAPLTWQMYFPSAQNPIPLPLRVVYVRTAGGDAAGTALAIRRAAREVAPAVPYAELRPLARNLEPQLRPWRLGAAVFTAFGGLALALAALGVYGVVSYDVAQRMREMGVRMALGARSGSVLRLVVVEGVRVATVGVALGVVAALVAARWVGPLLFDTPARDPLVVGGVAATLLAVAAAACFGPAWRATRVAPASVLRGE